MKLILKILSFFKPEKFNIICHNSDEWVSVQRELINDGYRWECCYFVNEIYVTPASAGINWSFPIIIKNYRSGDYFGGKFLIMDDYNFVIRSKKKFKTM